MIIKRIVILTLLLASCCCVMKAQNDEVTVGVRIGHNTSLGNFAAFSLETQQSLYDNFNICGGVQYSTIGRTSLEVRPAYVHDLNWGKLSTEILLAYTKLQSVNSIAAGVGVGLSGKWVGMKLGYYYRLFGGSGSKVKEPFNIYYDLSLNLLPMIDDWKLNLIITNNEIFELERHYQPSFIARLSYFPLRYLGISLGLGCKPAGMFNMSADYYQTFIKSGICYRW